MTRRHIFGVGAVVALVVLTIGLASLTLSRPSRPAAGTQAPAAGASVGAGASAATSGDPASSASTSTASPGATPRPEPGHEVFGFVPYWEMNDGIEAHVAKTKLSTLALFSVTNGRDGSLDTSQTGYKRITGGVGKRLIRGAHDRGANVQVVFSSLTTAKNEQLFGSAKMQDAAIKGLVKLVGDLGVDGVNVDVERLEYTLVPAYTDFIGRLRAALRAEKPKAQVSVATAAGLAGAAMAKAAFDAGADRIFLMGYDYHYAGSDPGASAPMDRRDGGFSDLVSSLDLYESVGVPVEKTILGLPLYGMRWRVVGPWLGAPSEGDGAIWVPADNPKFLAKPPIPPVFDPIEVVEFYSVPPPASASEGPSPSGSPDPFTPSGWQAIYVDSPATLEPKLRLADDRGLAGAGFWAIGYERGLPDYSSLIARFAAGKLD
jgi:hypothetical protein